MSYQIVVARFNENIDWLQKEEANCIIYNKGESLNIKNEIILENVGRESETYLQYIILNYDSLPDVVVFTQARISDHVGKNDVNYLLALKDGALVHGTSQNFETHRLSLIPNVRDWDKEWNLKNDGYYYLQDNYKNKIPITFEQWFIKHIQTNFPNPISIFWKAIFAVKREYIVNKPKEYYERLLLEVNHHINSTEGHFFERSWYYIFT